MRGAGFTMLELLAALVILSGLAAASASIMRSTQDLMARSACERDALAVFDQWTMLGRPGLAAVRHDQATVALWSHSDGSGRRWRLALRSGPMMVPSAESEPQGLAVEVSWMTIDLEQHGLFVEVIRLPLVELQDDAVETWR